MPAGDGPLDPLAEHGMRRPVGDDRDAPAEGEGGDEVRLHAGERAFDGEGPGRDGDRLAGFAVAVGAAKQGVDLSAECHSPNPQPGTAPIGPPNSVVTATSGVRKGAMLPTAPRGQLAM